jgi:WD40 repeat protein/DNA-binding SARP family transcriptional activator
MTTVAGATDRSRVLGNAPEGAYGARVEILLLGPVEVLRDGAHLALGGPKQRTVLALLASHAGSVVSTDSLLEGVWGESPTPGARSTLQTYVSNLRTGLGDVIVREGGGYRLDIDSGLVDKRRFEEAVATALPLVERSPVEAADTLRSALALWRGHPFADVAESFPLELEARRLDELRLSAVEARIDAELLLGHHAELVPELEVLCTDHPLREGFRAQQMLALYRCGRQAEALRAYQKTRTYLADELGLEPSPELRELERRILAHDPSLLLDVEPQVQTLAFLLTDIEDSTVLWELHTPAMRAAVAEHDRIVFEAVERHGGKVVKRVGDGIDIAFAQVAGAAAAAAEIQRALAAMDWGETPVLVRMAIDVGEVESRTGDYFGPVLNRAGRLLAAAHGGQVLLSGDAHAQLAAAGGGWQAKALGEVRLKGIGRPVHVFQLVVDGQPVDFPPLRLDHLPPPVPPRAFGGSVRGYELREQVGRGDFGLVYRAYQPSVGREVAIKVIRPELVNRPSFVRGFEAEARLVAQLEHPYVVSLYDYWRDPEGAYLVMRWLRGASLRQALEKGPWNLAPAARLVSQVAGALSYAHRQGIVHRDLKPANVLLDEDGNAYLSDFGIAARLVDRQDPGGVVTSSPAYLPPEELSGDPHTPRSDLYCLGLLTFELLTGRRPPMDGALPSVAELHPQLPRELDAVIARATAADPEARYETADAFAAAFAGAAGQAVVAPEPAFTPAENPYKGLRAFEESDENEFFGRDALVAELSTALQEHRLVAVVGPSGIGKSSVVKAGLIPALRRGAAPGSESWLLTDMFPGSYPFEELGAALVRVAVERPDDLVEQLSRDELGLRRVTKQVLPADTELVLVIDQFEELFTLTADQGVRRRFLDGLTALVDDARSRTRVLVTLRADFLDHPLRYPEFGELVRAGMVAVSTPSEDELAAAIERPAATVGVRFEPGLVSQIIRDVQDEPGALPLLQFALTELFASRERDVLTLEGYRATGGVIGALGGRAEEIYSSLDRRAQDAARQVFLRLVSVDAAGQDTRRRVRTRELRRLELEPLTLDEILDRFGAHRLLTFDREPLTRSPTVEVAHEALLDQWERLRAWIDERRADLLQHRRLVEAVDEWQESGRIEDLLPRQRRLLQFEAWARGTDLALTDDERAYLAEGRARADQASRRRARLRRGIVAGFAVLALAASAAALFALGQRGNARDAATRAVAERLGAQALLKDDLDRSLLLARESVAQYDSPATRGNLLAALLRSPAAIGTLHGDGDVQDRVAVSPDGRLVATGDYFGTLMFFDLATRMRSGAPLQLSSVDDPGPYGLWALAFSPDGRTLAVVSKGLRELDLVDARSRAVRRVARFPFDAATRSFTNYGLAYSPDGRILLTSEAIFDNEGNHVRTELVFRDGATGRRLGRTVDAGTLGTEEPYVGHGPRLAVSFTPDGRSIVAGDTRHAVLWDAKTGRRLRTFAPALSFAVSSSGGALVLGREDGSVALANLDTGKAREFSGHHGGAVNGAAFTPDGKSVLTAGTDGDVLVWDVASGTIRETLSGHVANVQAPAVTPDGRTAVTVAHDATTLVWDLTGTRRLSRSSSVVPSTYSDLSVDGKTAAVSTERDIRLVDGSSLRVRGSIPVARRPWWVAFSPNGSRLAVTLQGPTAPAPGAAPGGTVALYEVKTRRLLARRAVPYAWGFEFDPSGKTIAVAREDGRVSFLDGHSLAATGKPIVQPQRPLANGDYAHTDVDWSPDGRLLAVTYWDAGRIAVFDTTAGKLVADLPQKPHAFQAAFASHGSLLVTGGNRGIPSFWDTRTWKLVARPAQGHGSAIIGMSVDPGGRTLATAGNDDGDVLLWDVASHRQIGTALIGNGPYPYVFYSQDGRRLLAISPVGPITLWDVDPESWKRRACSVAGRNLSRDEWRDFVGDRPYHATCP